MSSAVLAVAVACVTAAGSFAQQQTTSSDTKTFEVVALNGNNLVVRLPEGTRELTVPDDFRFVVDGQSLSVHQLQVGMRGTATITTRTTVTPVTVTEVRNGTVLQAAAGTIVVRTGDEIRRFSQSDVDKRGIQIMRDGKPAQVSDFREGDRLSATIITSRPPQITTEREVQATLARAEPRPAAPARAPAPPPAALAPPPALESPDLSSAPPVAASRTLPKTASSWPLVQFVSVLLLAVGLLLTGTRRFVD